ncbi:MAG: hypothetical protein Q4B01_08540 [Eubacteriales bacterium]|nr:hypothetical protein [Eubacteriales bacterium]
MRKKVHILTLLSAAVLLLNGCSSGFSPAMTGVQITKKGTITQVIKENFQEANYSEQELTAQISNAVDRYNTEKGDTRIKAGKLAVSGGVADLKMIYETSSDYSRFNRISFYAGDITGAIQEGYAFDGSFYPVRSGVVNDQNPVWGSSLMSGTNYRTVVFEEAMLVEVPGEICYVSDNLSVTGKSTAVAKEAGIAYILYQ